MDNNTSDKLSIKNLLFTKAIPNHVISASLNGYKIYACIDCGDKFVFESSYNDHINRKSVKISYMCRHCNLLKTFTNRCNLLGHIRAHAFKTATINVSDLKVEPLPLCFYKHKPTEHVASPTETTKVSSTEPSRKATSSSTPTLCFECKANVTTLGVAYKDRSTHYMKYSNEVLSCPVCLFALPTVCALKAHLRIHLKIPPYYCPECGIHLANKNIHYPYNHDCEGFKMMRATARLNCTVPECSLFHPNDFKEHMKKYHLKTVYKCPFCVVACFNESTMDKHLKGHKNDATALVFYQCDICPSRYVLQNSKTNEHHLKSHVKSTVFPCWVCGTNFKEVSDMLRHFMKHHNKSEVIQNAVNSIYNPSLSVSKPKRIYRVLKKCDQCKRSFTYKCKFDEIPILPTECPYKCTSTMDCSIMDTVSKNLDPIICHLCNDKISQNWQDVKKHYAEFHKTHKCLEAKILVTRIDISKYLHKIQFRAAKLKKTNNKISKKNRHPKLNKHSSSCIRKSLSKDNKMNDQNINYVCNKCGEFYEEKIMLERHIKSTHKGDPCMAYQCLECGLSYMVKPSFAKHLLLEHGIEDTDEYIKNKKCYNAGALSKTYNAVSSESLKDNQCNICLQEFEDAENLGKHYRVHGMAFLVQNTSKNNSKESH